jgi:hypothetical protein
MAGRPNWARKHDDEDMPKVLRVKQGPGNWTAPVVLEVEMR